MRKLDHRGVVSCLRFAVLVAMAGCLTDEEVGTEEQEVLVGSFDARFDDTLRGGGVVAQGASLAGREDNVPNATADIAIAGIPPGSTVHRALLYWTISGGADTTATINGIPVNGVQVAAAGQTCWGQDNAAFRADVTAQVSGNGTYTIGDLPSSTGVDTDGAALVVVYQNNNSGIRRRVMIRDGAITTSGSGEVVVDTFTGVASPIASGGQFHMVVGDGQSFPDGEVVFNGGIVGVDQFPGSDGSLWDVNTYNVAVPAAVADLTWSSQTTGDCLVYAAAVVDWNVGVCGDNTRTGGEACDDGDLMNGDGCNALCNVEPGWTCTG
jgi:cysteine-rich repeat protein